MDNESLDDNACFTGTRHTRMATAGPWWNLIVFCEACGYVMTGEARRRMLDMA
jgi:hypothetical protein